MGDKDSIKPMKIIEGAIAVLSIVLTLIGKIDLETFKLILVLAISAIVIGVVASYVHVTNKNSEDIKDIKENFKFEDRLNRLEMKVFGK